MPAVSRVGGFLHGSRPPRLSVRGACCTHRHAAAVRDCDSRQCLFCLPEGEQPEYRRGPASLKETSLQRCKPSLLRFPLCATPVVTPGDFRAGWARPHGHHVLRGQTIALPESRFPHHGSGLNRLGLQVYIILLFFHTCMRETHRHALLHVVPMNVLDNRSKSRRQHLAVWTAELERSRRDSAWKPLLKSLYGSLQFFSSSSRGEGRVQRSAGMSLNFVRDWFCCFAYITHLILPLSLVNCSPLPSS